MKQLHKKFTDYQIKELITRYLKKKIARKYIQKILGIKKTRFFSLVKQLKIEKNLIKNKDIPIKYYNYSYMKYLLE